jgi:nucleotide-binding universal stress UspA family protein
LHADRVLVATDLSEAADAALIEAHERAGSTGKLLVCCARPSWPSLHQHAAPPASGEARPGVEFLPCTREAVTARVVARTGRNPDQFSVVIDDDEPHVAIVKRAEAWDAHLVVVGHRGGTGLSRILLGSVAERVVRFAHCPVLVVRPKTGSKRIVAGTDFSDPALPAFQAACDEARRIGGQVTLVHSVELAALPVEGFGPTGAGAWTTALEQLDTEATRRLKEAVETCGVRGEYRLTHERPAAALVRVAEACGADLLVVGTRGRTGIARVLLGSVAEGVVRTAGCSVLVVRLREGV